MPNRHTTLHGLNALWIVSALAIGCQSESPAAENSEQANTPIAEVEFADGSQLSFVELEPGALMANAEGEPQSQAITLFQAHSNSVLDLYESAANAPAPAALREAQARVAHSVARSSSPDTGGDLTPSARVAPANGDVGVNVQALSANDFNAQYCATDHDFRYCYLSVTGTWIVTEQAQHVHLCVNSVSGSINRTLEYDSGLFGSWTTAVSGTIIQGSTRCTRLEVGNSANYRVTVDQASGDTYHGAFYGNR